MSDMNTVQKIQKDKMFNEKLILQWQTEKMAEKWPNFTKWPNAFFHGQRSLKMANLAAL